LNSGPRAESISYLAWAWNAGGGWTCRDGPTLITDYDGTPTGFGVGFRDHLRSLARR
jgi:endoglucanase